MNLNTSITLCFALLAVCAVVVVTFVHHYDNSRPVLGQNTEEEKSLRKILLSETNGLKGSIVSLQYNKSSMPVATLSGKWKIVQRLINNSNKELNFDFTSNITFTRVDGTGSQKYQLRDFKNYKPILTDKMAIINGTISLITKSKNLQIAPNQGVSLLPLSIRIMNLETVIITIDSDLVRHYFGDTPIYGTVSS
jgi:hypothetical protein